MNPADILPAARTDHREMVDDLARILGDHFPDNASRIAQWRSDAALEFDRLVRDLRTDDHD